jgi:hypothetical protein
LINRMCFKRLNIFAKTFNSTSEEYSPHPRGENLLRQLYTCNGP